MSATNDENNDVFDEMVEGTRELVEFPANLLEPQDANEFLQFMMGATTEPPAALQKILNNLANKLNMGMAYILAMNMQRSNKLVTFMKSAEDIMFDEANILNKQSEEISELYDKASKTLNSTLEYTRKYILQNKDNMNLQTDKADKLKSMLLALPASKLNALMEKIEKGEI